MIKIIINKRGKKQIVGTHLWFLDFYRLFLNLTLLTTIGFLIWYGIKLFGQHVFSAGIGSGIFITTLIFFIWLWKHTKRNSWRKPSMKFTIVCLICLFLITAFAGCEPMATYKDEAINKATTIYNEQKVNAETKIAQYQAEQEQRKITKENAERERLSNLGMDNVDVVVKEIDQNKELRIGIEVLEMVNAIREERGSSKLLWDDKLYEYSLAHSKDMVSAGRMFHTDMYKAWAENAWWGGGSSWNAKDIVDSWMGSPKHRTWLLCPNLKHVAVGIAYSSNGMYASWTFWRNETTQSDWWYQYTPDNPPEWWY